MEHLTHSDRSIVCYESHQRIPSPHSPGALSRGERHDRIRGQPVGRGEAAASQRLAEKGFQILEADWHSRWGEIDLIAADGETLVFCEVKTRLEDSVGSTREAVGPAKRKKLTETALCYLSEHPSELQPRFDVIEVTLSRADGAVLSVEHLENAFPAEQ